MVDYWCFEVSVLIELEVLLFKSWKSQLCCKLVVTSCWYFLLFPSFSSDEVNVWLEGNRSVCFMHVRYMEKRNGLLGFVNMELEFLAALLERIQCIHTVRELYWEKPTFQSLRWIRSCGNLVENGLEVTMTCWPRTVITSVMNFVKGLVCQNFQVRLIFIFSWEEYLKLESW